MIFCGAEMRVKCVPFGALLGLKMLLGDLGDDLQKVKNRSKNSPKRPIWGSKMAILVGFDGFLTPSRNTVWCSNLWKMISKVGTCRRHIVTMPSASYVYHRPDGKIFCALEDPPFSPSFKLKWVWSMFVVNPKSQIFTAQSRFTRQFAGLKSL